MLLVKLDLLYRHRTNSLFNALYRTPTNFNPKRFKKGDAAKNIVTTGWGAPIVEKNASITVGPRGPLLLQDAQFIDEIAHFNRERIPERVVHAKGGGAFGHFVVTYDITKYCAAKIFEKVGKTTKIAVRFSTTAGESGSADTVRDPRGFAVKFYTEEGIWDLVGNNMPVFFIRDPIMFPSLVHSQKRHPATHLHDTNYFWDFLSSRPESVHHAFILFGDRGIPDGFRHMNGYGNHAFKMVNSQGQPTYCKFHYKPVGGVKCLNSEEASCIAGRAPDYAIEDLYEAISDGSFPKWNLYVQLMSTDAAEKHPFNPFDATKVWSQSEYPLNPVGDFVLDKNPTNYFAEIEQLAFSPAHLVPGIEPSPDKLLAGRMFAYGDTQRHRLGANYLQLPINCPFNVKHYQRDGPMAYNNFGDTPVYFPNTFDGSESRPKERKSPPSLPISGDVNRHDTGDEDNFSQARALYEKVFDDPQRERFIAAVVESMKGITEPTVKQRTLENFAKVDGKLEKKIIALLEEDDS
ncbi:Cat [Trypoxylus dichotomus]